jgi:hypothetical protein
MIKRVLKKKVPELFIPKSIKRTTSPVTEKWIHSCFPIDFEGKVLVGMAAVNVLK